MSDTVGKMKPYIHKLHSVVHADTCPTGASYSEYVYLSEYEELEAERAQLRAEHATMQKMLRQMQDLATDRGIELARVREDAQRYPRLRVNLTRPAEPWSAHWPESFDSIVDVSRAALAGRGEGEKHE